MRLPVKFWFWCENGDENWDGDEGGYEDFRREDVGAHGNRIIEREGAEAEVEAELAGIFLCVWDIQLFSWEMWEEPFYWVTQYQKNEHLDSFISLHPLFPSSFECPSIKINRFKIDGGQRVVYNKLLSLALLTFACSVQLQLEAFSKRKGK